jgi:mRNA interferase MazF
MRRGAVVWLNLEDATPPEVGKKRPAIVVSNSEQNALLDSVVAVPLSTQPPHIWPLRLEYAKLDNRMSFAVVPGIRQVKKSRILSVVEIAPAEFLAVLEDAIAAYLSD